MSSDRGESQYIYKSGAGVTWHVSVDRGFNHELGTRARDSRPAHWVTSDHVRWAQVGNERR